MSAARKAGRGQRSRQEIAGMDRKPNLAVFTHIEIRMRCQKRFRLGLGCVAETVHIMMSVSFGMGNADQGAKRQVLLHGKPGLTGQVLAGDEEIIALRAPLGRPGGIDDRLVDALTRFRRSSAITKRTRFWKRVVGIIGLVDDEVAERKRAKRRFRTDLTRHRLLDVEQFSRDWRDRAVPVE